MDKLNDFDSFIFTHVPKCGGTSFRNFLNDSALFSGLDKNDIYIPGENGLSIQKNIKQLNRVELNKFKRNKFNVLGLHSPFGFHKEYQPDIQNPFYFIMLRDPILRYISHYNFFNQKLGYNGCRGISLNSLELDKFAYLTAIHGNLMVKYILDLDFNSILSDPMLMVEAKQRLISSYDQFGLVENMNKTVKILRAHGPKWLQWLAVFPKLNASVVSKVFQLPDSKLELLANNNKLDIGLYDFAVTRFNQILID